MNNFRELFAGLDHAVPLLGGARRAYVNLDNAATTPPFRAVVDHVAQLSEWYSSVHRGTGFKSQLSTELFRQARQSIAGFVGADPDYHTLIFCGNTTDAVNRLCQHFSLQPGELFLTTIIEHHSNLLPWRFKGPVDYVQAKWPCGMIDVDHLEQKLREHQGKVRLVAISGASNVTGLLPPLKRIARLAHEHGALVLVDGSQLIAHRPIEMGAADDPERIDFLVFSGHKLYAPFGSGGLIGPKAFFAAGRPAMVGGGTVNLVTLDEVEWAGIPEKEEAGTPNLLGICAMAKAMQVLRGIGMDAVAAHEQALSIQAFAQLQEIPGIRIYGGCQLVNIASRIGVIPIQADNYDHALLAAILGYEWGIGVRNGCFCAHPYIKHLLGISDEERQGHLETLRGGSQPVLPGFVRISLGLYNTPGEIDYLATALKSIVREGPRGRYHLDAREKCYQPEGFRYDFAEFLP